MFSARWRHAWVEAASGLLYPPHCAGCRKAVSGRLAGLCRDCRRGRIRLDGPRCAVCAQPYGGAVPGTFRCMNCGDRELAFEFATAAYRSRGVVRDLIHRFKYHRKLHLRHLLARLETDYRLKISHHHRIGMRSGYGTDDVKGVFDVGHPVAHRFVQRIFQRL